MSLPNRIELVGGADRALQGFAWLTWLAALTSVLLNAQRMPLWLLALVAAMLLCSVPWRPGSNPLRGRLVLHANGQAQWGEHRGLWLDSTWSSRWFAVIRFQGQASRQFIWISAGSNTKDDFRHLITWCNFSPQSPTANANNSH
ncbi:MAG TPA: protein YgfX [Xanthomonadales bacterium]|nr:protein YgfX [Xanthomonadales bacterium]